MRNNISSPRNLLNGSSFSSSTSIESRSPLPPTPRRRDKLQWKHPPDPVFNFVNVPKAIKRVLQAPGTEKPKQKRVHSNLPKTCIRANLSQLSDKDGFLISQYMSCERLQQNGVDHILPSILEKWASNFSSKNVYVNNANFNLILC